MEQPPLDALATARRKELTHNLAQAGHETAVRHNRAIQAATATRTKAPSTLVHSSALIGQTLNRVIIHLETLASDAGLDLDQASKDTLTVLHHDLVRLSSDFHHSAEHVYTSQEQRRAAA